MQPTMNLAGTARSGILLFFTRPTPLGSACERVEADLRLKTTGALPVRSTTGFGPVFVPR